MDNAPVRRVVTVVLVAYPAVLSFAILVPATAPGALLARSTTWRDWTAFGFLFARSIEVFQGLFLPERSATYVDVVANTLGALLGPLAAGLVRMMDGKSDI